jgi:hypothetical protein
MPNILEKICFSNVDSTKISFSWGGEVGKKLDIKNEKKKKNRNGEHFVFQV